MTITGNSVVGVSNNGTFNSTSKRDKKEGDNDFDDKQEIKRTKYTTPPQPLYKAYNLRPPIDKTLENKNTTFSSASTDASYVPYFDSPTSENSIKTKKPYYIDYFIGLGNVEWDLIEGATRNLQGLREFFDDELWQCIFLEIRTQYSYVDIPERVFDLCGTVVKIASKQQDPRQRRTEIKSYLRSYNTNGEFEEIMHDILYRL
ncbi:19872_t:CDS:2 [Racocetra fulgida]|uniref:19872_t:CDS:1 n=1 Tax=Racocetra fulgida TaxID=60492 RepID=A0A9N9F018_9GLOM|nr:19872_t:CDS:2 [Racocetra fulgida]